MEDGRKQGGSANSPGRPITRKYRKGEERTRSRSNHSMRSTRSNVTNNTNNMYNVLSDNVESHEIIDRQNNVSSCDKNKSSFQNTSDCFTLNNMQNDANVKKFKPPPITFKQTTIVLVRELLKKQTGINMNSVSIKITEYGIKVHMSDMKQYDLLCDYCMNNNIQFFTHTPRERRKVKFCLYGLWNMPLEELREELSSLGIYPCEINVLPIFEKRYNDQCIYKLSFMQSDHVRISNLRQTKFVFKCVVRWQYYKSKAKLPTRCSNCQEWGHGDDNCHLLPKCVRCAGNHKSDKCPHLPPIDPEKPLEKRNIPVALVKCANCGKNHTANFSGCATRYEYLNVQERMRQNNQLKRNNTRPQPPPIDNRSFPPLSCRNTPPTHNAWRNPPILSSNQDNPNDMLSVQECVAISNELMQKLSQCQNRNQQILAVIEITAKYAGHP